MACLSEKGHLGEVCSFKGTKQGAKSQSKWSGRCRSRGRSHNNRLVNVAADQSPEHNGIELFLNKIVGSSAHPIVVDLLINDIKLSMEIDMGAAVTIISECAWKQQFSQLKLKHQRFSVLLKTYTGEVMPVCGETVVRVHHQDQECSLTLTVVRGMDRHYWVEIGWRHMYLGWTGRQEVWLKRSAGRVSWTPCSRSTMMCSKLGLAQ